MSVLSAIGRLAAEYNATRNRYLTERQIHALPYEIQKDIGWPDLHEPHRISHRPLGIWAGDADRVH